MRQATFLAAMTIILLTPMLAALHASASEETMGRRRVTAQECLVEPRSADSLSAELVRYMEGEQPAPSLTISVPLGAEADDETVARVTKAVRGILACLNAGDLSRAAAWMTDNGLQRVFSQMAVDQAGGQPAALTLTSPQPRDAGQWLRLLAISNVSTLPDGRTAAFVVINDPSTLPIGPQTRYVVFVKRGGAWLLDDWADMSAAPPQAASAGANT